MKEEFQRRVIGFVKSQSYFSLADHGEEGLVFETRDNGNVGDEEPGQHDIDEACKLRKSLAENFPGHKVTIDVIDEWVMVNFIL